jgi:hypothetical protein
MILSNVKLIDNPFSNQAYKNCIWTFDLETDINFEKDLATSNYKSLDSNLPIAGRQEYINGSSNMLDTNIKLLDELVFKKVKQLAFSNGIKALFLPRWPIVEDEFDQNFFPITVIYKDPPNFKMSKHLDNQRVVANAIINLSDNNSTTEFFDYRDPSKVIFSTESTRNKGVLFLNTPAALHHIKNFNADRYIANTSIMIKKW